MKKFVTIPRIAVLLTVGLSAGLIWFNVFYYPAFGLKGLKPEQHQAALLRAGKGFAASQGLTLESVLWSKFQTHKKEAFAWGTLVLLTATGEKVYLWVSLEWWPRWQRWQRLECYLLADPRDRLFFAESLQDLGNLRRIYFTLMNLGREELRRWREVWQGYQPLSRTKH